MLQGTSCKREIKMKCLELDFHTFKPFHKLEREFFQTKLCLPFTRGMEWQN